MVSAIDAQIAQLWLVESFVNSLDVSSGQDDLTDTDRFARWLKDHGRAVTRVSDADLTHARRLRSQLRQVLIGHHDGDHERLDPDALNELTRALEVKVEFDAAGNGFFRAAGEGIESVLAEIVVKVAEASAGDGWRRLKLCAADDCFTAYFDSSKNCSRRWCSMQVCGNRYKTRSYYSRRTAKPAETDTSAAPHT